MIASEDDSSVCRKISWEYFGREAFFLEFSLITFQSSHILRQARPSDVLLELYRVVVRYKTATNVILDT